MDFVAVLLYTQQVFFFLKCLLVFQIKSKCYKKLFNTDFLSSKNEEITLPHEFIFVFVWSFIGALLSETSCQKHGVQKKYKKRKVKGWGGGSHIGLSIEGGFKSSAHYDIERLKGRP